MTLTKTQIIDRLYQSTDLNRTQATRAVEAMLETIKNTLEFGEDVLISGFGKFYVKEKDRRRGRNPATNEDLMLEARRVVNFRSSGVLKDKMNMERRKHPRMAKRLPFKLGTENFEIAAETINLSCNGAYCQVNNAFPLMTNLKIVLALPYGDEEDELDYVECSGVVVRSERDECRANMGNSYNIAVYFNEIGVSEKAKIMSFLKK